MPKKKRAVRPQPELFPRSMVPRIPIEKGHRLVILTDATDWPEIEGRGRDSVEQAQERGRPPAASAGLAGRDDAQGDTGHDLARGGGPNPPLCAGALPLRSDRDGLDTRTSTTLLSTSPS